MRLHTFYINLLSFLTRYESDEMTDAPRERELSRHIKEIKRLLKATLDEQCETGLCTLGLHFWKLLMHRR